MFIESIVIAKFYKYYIYHIRMKFNIFQNIRYCRYILVLIIMLLSNTLVFSAVCPDDFSNVQYFATSDIFAYQLSSENNINVIHYDLSTHPLTLFISIESNQADCYEQEDFGLVLSGTLTLASSFEQNQLDGQRVQYLWGFTFPSSTVRFTTPYVDFNFINTINTSNQDTLRVKVDSEIPRLQLEEVRKDSQSFNIEQVSTQNNFKSGDEIELRVLGRDDVSVQNISVLSHNGAELLISSRSQERNDEFRLSQLVRLEDSPFEIIFEVIDQFDSRSTLDFSMIFDSFDPSVRSIEITSYELTSSLDHIIRGEVVVVDDFPIQQSGVVMYAILQDNRRVEFSIQSCSTNLEIEDVLKPTTCVFQSQPVSLDETLDAMFYTSVRDGVGNLADDERLLTIEVDSNPPQISKFELINPLNVANVVSSLVEDKSKIVLEFSNELPALYQETSFSGGQRGTKTTISPDFGLLDESIFECESTGQGDRNQRCVWEVDTQVVAGLESFNISILLRDVVGNTNRAQIEIRVIDDVPEISMFRLVERGNERNGIFESFERVRMETFIEGIEDESIINIFLNGTEIIFRNSPDEVSFSCQSTSQSEFGDEGLLCFSNDFELNRGFDGDRTEELYLVVQTITGVSDVANETVKIFKISEDESIDYFELDEVILHSLINRRVIQNQGQNIFHEIRIRPRNNREEFRIVSVQLLGVVENEDEFVNDARLRYIELQNQTSQGVVMGNRNTFFVRSHMPRLLSGFETQRDTQTTVVLSIVKTDIDTIYKDETIQITLPIRFYDTPRDINSNIALIEKLLDDIEGISESSRKGRSLLDIYMTYHRICNVYNSISTGVQTISGAWNTISLALGNIIPGSQAVDASTTPPAKTTSMLGNIDDIMGKICMLATCEFSQNLVGGALNSITGDFQLGDYMTGRRSFLGNMVCQ